MPNGSAWGGGSPHHKGLEAWAILLAIRLGKPRLQELPLLIRSDSTVALALASKLMSSPSPVLNWIGAESTLKLEPMGIPRLTGHHQPGRLNVDAVWLSRPHDRPPEVPDKLKQLKIHRLDGQARQTADGTTSVGPGANNCPPGF